MMSSNLRAVARAVRDLNYGEITTLAEWVSDATAGDDDNSPVPKVSVEEMTRVLWDWATSAPEATGEDG